MEEEDYSSDTSDEDYIPLDAEAGSDEEESGEEENLALLQDEEAPSQKKRGKRKVKFSSKTARKKKGGISLGEEDEKCDTDKYNEELAQNIAEEKEEKKAVDEKQRADSLWADFMKDTGGLKAGSRGATVTTKPQTTTLKSSQDKAPQTTVRNTSLETKKVTVVKEYDFAGETVKVTKQVDADSKEAKTSVKVPDNTPPPSSSTSSSGKRSGGLGSVLGKIEKKAKIGTLEKSKYDWDSFKRQEGIEEDLKVHNKGRQGYLERQDFLERTDHRQFEIEKNLRQLSRDNKR